MRTCRLSGEAKLQSKARGDEFLTGAEYIKKAGYDHYKEVQCDTLQRRRGSMDN